MRTRRAPRLGAALLAAALLTASPLAGQEAPGRDGFWFDAGAGGGFDESMRWGPGIRLAAGTTIGSRLRLGLRAFQFEADPFGRAGSKSRSNVTATAAFYPSAGGHFFLAGGLGLATEQYQELVPGTTTARWATSEYLGAYLGLGHDIRLGDGDLHLTPTVDALFGLDEDGLDNPDFSLLFTMGLGVR